MPPFSMPRLFFCYLYEHIEPDIIDLLPSAFGRADGVSRADGE